MNIKEVEQTYAIGRATSDGYEFILETIRSKAAASWNSMIGYSAASDPATRRKAIQELKDEGWECVEVTITRKERQ